MKAASSKAFSTYFHNENSSNFLSAGVLERFTAAMCWFCVYCAAISTFSRHPISWCWSIL